MLLAFLLVSANTTLFCDTFLPSQNLDVAFTHIQISIILWLTVQPYDAQTEALFR